MLDFVILFHELPVESARNSHWDLMLRDGDNLLCWALESNPLTQAKSTGTKLADHRLAYLEFEGEISHGRGHVTRVARGTYSVISSIHENDWKVVLALESGRRIEVECAKDRNFAFIDI